MCYERSQPQVIRPKLATKRIEGNLVVDWNSVKKMTLWHYEDLISKTLRVLSYDFIREYYNHSMKKASIYAKHLLGFYPKYKRFVITLTNTFQRLDDSGIRSYSDLVHRVETREKCEHFLEKAELSFVDLISTLNYIFRWVLPFRNVYLKQLVDRSNEVHKEYIDRLRERDMKFNLDILEYGRTKEGRTEISIETGISEAFILDLTNRADLTRLPYMSWKTVNHLCGAGYNDLNKLAGVDIERLKEDMKKYFDKKGIKLGPFIDLRGLVLWAKSLPKIVEI